jgi:hypothetical protein
MKITICGSIAFYEQMLEIKQKLESLGHEVDLPPSEVEDDQGKMISVAEYYSRRKAGQESDTWIWDRKEWAIRFHFKKIEWADSVLILNYDKNGVVNYIGGNTFLEIGVAFHFGKKIYLLNDIPEVSYKEEILGMKPIVIGSDLNNIN